MPSFERSFDLDGVGVQVQGEGDDLAVVVDLLLGAYAGDAGDGAVRIELVRGDGPGAPPEVAPRFRFPPLQAWAEPTGWHLLDDVAELHVRPSPGVIHGRVATGAPMPLLSRFAGLSLWVALMECLRARGRYPLHGAALVSPAGETVLISGTKCAGKSTITLALCEAGWQVVTDDTLFIEPGAGGGPTLLGYKKRFHIRPDLLERRPDLRALARRPLPFEPQDKLWLDLEERVPGCTRRSAPAPSRIVFPAIVDAPASLARELTPRDALLRLLADSSFVFLSASEAPGHLSCLRALADGARAAEWRCGRDVLSSPERYLELLEGTPWPSSASASS